MKVIFVRHGQTEFNKMGRIMSRSNDESLSEEGLEEVRKVVTESGLQFDTIFSSPLKRAYETAVEFSKTNNTPIHLHEDIMEREFGILSNKTWEEVAEITGKKLTYDIWKQGLIHDLSHYGGETHESTVDRLKKFMNHLKSNHAHTKPLVVTHGGVLRTLYSLFPHVEPKSMRNVSIHEFDI